MMCWYGLRIIKLQKKKTRSLLSYFKILHQKFKKKALWEYQVTNDA